MRYIGLEFIFKKLYSKLLFSLTLILILIGFSVSSQAETYELSQGNSANSLWISGSDIPSRRSSEIRISKDIGGSFVRFYSSRFRSGSRSFFGDIGLNTFKFDSCYKTWYRKTKCKSTIKTITLKASPTIVTASTNSTVGNVDISWAPVPTVMVDKLKLEVSKGYFGPWVHILDTQGTSYTQSQLSEGSYKYRLTVVYTNSSDNSVNSDSFVSNTVVIPPSGKTIFIHTDLLGTPVAETDINGDVL